MRRLNCGGTLLCLESDCRWRYVFPPHLWFRPVGIWIVHISYHAQRELISFVRFQKILSSLFSRHIFWSQFNCSSASLQIIEQIAKPCGASKKTLFLIKNLLPFVGFSILQRKIWCPIDCGQISDILGKLVLKWEKPHPAFTQTLFENSHFNGNTSLCS